MAKPILFGELTSADVARIAKAKKKPIVIVPMGALEAHGDYLPLWSDSIVPYKLAQKVSEKTGALVLPPIPYGFCYTLRPWAGTMSLKSRTYALIIEDITRELVRNGFQKILFLNGHGANASIASHTLAELSGELRFTACIVSWWGIKGLDSGVGHADENEASIVMALSGWKKRKTKQEKCVSFFGKVIPAPKGVLSSRGYVGKVGGESVEKGKRMEKIIVDKLTKLVKADLILKE